MKIVDKDLPGASTTLRIRLRKSSLWLVNTSSIPTLLDIVTSSPGVSSPSKGSKSKSNGNASSSQATDSVAMVDAATQILYFISKNCAQLYYPHLPRLAKELHAATKLPDLMETLLRALAAVACLDTDQFPNDR